MRFNEFNETYVPSYDTFANMQNVDSLFKTARGSTYAHFNDGSTIRDRSGQNHVDKTTGQQGRSTRTIYMAPDAFTRLGVQGSTPPMQLVPDGANKVKAVSTQSYGPKPVGTQFTASQSYSLKPAVGLLPVELNGGKLLHVGNPITEVIPRSQYQTSTARSGAVRGSVGGLGAPTRGPGGSGPLRSPLELYR